jgi:hypothetical protein
MERGREKRVRRRDKIPGKMGGMAWGHLSKRNTQEQTAAGPMACFSPHKCWSTPRLVGWLPPVALGLAGPPLPSIIHSPRVPAHFFAAAATKEAMDGNQCPPNAAANEGGRPKDAVKRK